MANEYTQFPEEVAMPRVCSECKQEKPEFVWINDRYGIPYRKVCVDCGDKVRAEIEDWRFDAGYAGEHLEDDDQEGR